MNAVNHAGAPTRTAAVFIAPTAFLNAEVLAWRSARVASRSPALTFSVPTFHLPKLHIWRGPGGIGRRWSGAQAWLKCASLIPMAGWFAGSLRVSSEAPKWGPAHFSRSARDWLITSQSDATAPIRSAATQVGPLLSLGQLRQSHPVSAISGPGSHSQLQVHRSPRRHWLADWVGERASASAMACRSIAIRKG